MSEAPAAPVTENGVPPAAQEKVEETPGFKVFAGNLAYVTTDEGLKTFFAPVQEDILTAQVILRGTRSAGYGFVSLNTVEAAQKAVELLNGSELDGRQVIVEIAKPADQKEGRKERKVKRKPGRRGSKAVPGELTEAEANGEAVKAIEAAPATDDAAKPKKKKKNNRKKGRKTQEGEAAADGAVTEGEAASGTEGAAKKPRQRKPRAPRPPRPAGEEPAGEPSKNMLFVANLGFNIGDEELAAIFTDAGISVNSARIVRRRWGKPRKSKGYGFVDVGDEAAQAQAIELLQGKEVGGRPIAVKVAVNSQQEAEDTEGEAEASGPTEVKDESPETTVIAS